VTDELAPLLPALQDAGKNSLLVADENLAEGLAAVPDGQTVLTNRRDLADQAERRGLPCHFCDFDFSSWPAHSLDAIAYRISKEKAVVHHIANSAAQRLVPGGRLVLTGAKDEGIKTYAKTIGVLFGDKAVLEKQGKLYRVTARLASSRRTASPLDDRDYKRLRKILCIDGKPVYSKPGLFGWDKEDAGSALLAGHLPDFFAARFAVWRRQPIRLLDLGCGYGYLSLQAAALGIKDITATDNCAAALLACQHNFREHGIAGRVSASDAGDRLGGSFETIVCNPPFHQGFARSGGLTDKFLNATRRLLAPGGRALFVVNSFIPLETLAQRRFAHIATPVRTGKFKLVELG
jgi:16S rRNA (guanine1207-N2)-methyltransferase